MPRNALIISGIGALFALGLYINSTRAPSYETRMAPSGPKAAANAGDSEPTESPESPEPSEISPTPESTADGPSPAIKRERARIEAIGQAAEFSDEAAKTLVAALSHEDTVVRSQACWSLGRFGEAAHPYAAPIVEALGDDAWEVRHNATWALLHIRKNLGPLLTEALTHSDPWVRVQAARVLADVDPATGEKASGIMIEALNSEVPEIRIVATQSLATLGPKAAIAIPKLRAALGDDSELMRQTAVSALGSIGEAAVETVPDLAKAIGDEKRSVRVEAVTVLGMFGQQALPAKAALLEALNDDDKHVATAVTAMIGQLGPEVLPDLAQACRSEDDRLRMYAIDALSHSPHIDEATVSALREQLGHATWQTRMRAAVALGRKEPVVRAAVPDLIKALDDSDQMVRLNAQNALRAIGTRKALSALPKPDNL